ncbi:uncharacterized protein LOC135355109 [Latimeria chalumnae]|uniref:uncharacterized protein LOC135355109 n=1 Tax=Latimeria chalumnae TaxID=7897 RepID=UPI00313F07A4
MLKLTVTHLLCVGVLLSGFPGYLDAQVGGGGGGEYRVKLCGREFIRAVIFTCGGSRWKRLSLDLEAPPNYGKYFSCCGGGGDGRDDSCLLSSPLLSSPLLWIGIWKYNYNLWSEVTHLAELVPEDKREDVRHLVADEIEVSRALMQGALDSCDTAVRGVAKGVSIRRQAWLRGIQLLDCDGDECLHHLDVKRSLQIYLDLTKDIRKLDQIFVSYIHTDSFQSTSDADLEKFKNLQIDSSQLQKSSLLSGQESMEDLLSLYEDYSEFVPTTNSFDEYVHKIEMASKRLQNENGVFTTSGSNNFPWAKSPRRKRDFSMGLAGMCCKWGCTKTEISRLC